MSEKKNIKKCKLMSININKKNCCKLSHINPILIQSFPSVQGQGQGQGQGQHSFASVQGQQSFASVQGQHSFAYVQEQQSILPERGLNLLKVDDTSIKELPKKEQIIPMNNEFYKNYVVKDIYQGGDFLKKFKFLTKSYTDPELGSVKYVDAQTALKKGLCSFPNSQSYRQLRTNVASKPTNGIREAVRLESIKNYNGGLFIIDVFHIPEGISVWPAFWSKSVISLCEGVINIIEYVNSHENTSKNNLTNYSSIFSTKLCPQNQNNVTIDEQIVFCKDEPGKTYPLYKSIAQTGDGTSGYAINKKGGGVYACQWIPNGNIKMWFFPRELVNRYIPFNSTNINLSFWPKPYAEFKTCPNAFKNHKLIINTNLCGKWANNDFPNKANDCLAYVNDPNNDFSQAYWLINYIKVFQPQ